MEMQDFKDALELHKKAKYISNMKQGLTQTIKRNFEAHEQTHLAGGNEDMAEFLNETKSDLIAIITDYLDERKTALEETILNI